MAERENYKEKEDPDAQAEIEQFLKQGKGSMEGDMEHNDAEIQTGTDERQGGGFLKEEQ